jgi:UDP-3-O-[3-hydroxymyristoyl] N-acetylglucosamine deacetylase
MKAKQFPAVSRFQHTLRRPVRFAGIGLHTGRAISLTIRPRKAGAGIVFVRRDIPGVASIIHAHWRLTQATRLATVLGNQYGLSVATVEHLLAALRGCGVDNAVIELDGPEVPIMDGSAAPMVELIEQAGLQNQTVLRRFIRILHPVEVREGDKFARLEPSDEACFSIAIDFPSRAIGRQDYSLVLRDGVFQHQLAAARTFGFLDQIAALRACGLTRGGSLDNAIVIDGDRIINPEGLRFADEFVRHKLLDSIGDLYLAGAPIIGHYRAFKPGHGLNAALLRALFAGERSWTLETAPAAAATSRNLPFSSRF